MARAPKKAAAPKAAAPKSPPTPAAPPAAAAGGAATEATASSNGAPVITAGEGGDTPASGGQASTDPIVAGLVAIADRLDPRNQIPLIGSPIHPEIIDLGHGVTIAQADLISTTAPLLTSSAAEWNGQPEADRERMIGLAIDEARDQVAKAHAPAAQAGPTDDALIGDDQVVDRSPAEDGFVWVEGKSRDDTPYRRAGVVWDANHRFHQVADDQMEKLLADRHVLIRDIRE